MVTNCWKKFEWMTLNQSLLQLLLCPSKMDQDSHSVLKSYTMCQSSNVSVQKYLLMN